MSVMSRVLVGALVLLLAYVSTVDATQAVITKFIVVNGKRYATLDNYEPTALPDSVCTTTPLTLPTGWSVADPTDERTLYAMRAFTWGNWALVVDTGVLYTTGPSSTLYDSGNYLFGDATNGYYPPWCVLRILISGPTEPGDDALDQLRQVTSVANGVTFDGIEYATIDDQASDNTTVGCQEAWYALPGGWSLSDLSDNGRVATMGRTWGTQCLVTSGGAYDPRNLASCASITTTSTQVANVTYYKPNGCNTRILIKRNSPNGASYSSWPVRPSYTNAVLSGGRRYMTLDNAPVDDTVTCQIGAYLRPSSISLAAIDDGFEDVMKQYTWGTWCMHTGSTGHGTGQAVTSGTQCSTSGQYEVAVTITGEEFVAVTACPHRIMLSEPVSASSFKIRMHALVLTSTSSILARPELSAVDALLRGNEIPFDVVVTGGTSGVDLPDLEDAQGNPKYSAIFLTDYSLTQQNPDTGAFESSMSPREWARLRSYASRYHVRMVSMTTWPGVIPEMTAHAGSSSAYSLAFHSGVTADLAYPAPTSAVFNTVNGSSWITTAALTTPTPRITPLLTLSNDTSRIAAVTMEINAGDTEMLAFFFGTSRYLMISTITNTAVNWVFRGKYQGNRLMLLSTQVDDLLLSTETWVTAEKRRGDGDLGDPAYRCGASDMNHLRRVQDEYINAQVAPAGSSVKVEFAVNFYGSEKRNWFDDDDLLVNIATDNVDKFFYLSHTWSHLDLTCPDSDCAANGATTYAEANTELYKNNDAAAEYMYPYAANHTNYPYAWNDTQSSWSPRSMVTPKISGLYNAASLEAIWDNGIRSVVGDNSVTDLQPADVYHGYHTQTGVHGFPGVFVIPRFATNIFFDVRLPSELAGQLDFLYGVNGTLLQIYPNELSLAEIMDIEAERVVPVILQHRYDPYMFHQVNVDTFSWPNTPAGTVPIGGRTSLLEQWIQAVVAKYAEHSVLPIRSLKQDDLFDLHVQRLQRDNCGLQSYLNVGSTGTISSVEITATDDCDAVFTNLDLDTGNSAYVETLTLGTDDFDHILANSTSTVTVNVGAGVSFF